MQQKNYTVFLVDDERLICQGLRMLIDWNAIGYSVCGDAANGREALPLILQQKPDLVIADLKMPFIDGIELAKIIAKKQPSTRVIILTGHGDLQKAQEAIRANVFDFLLKPVDPDVLTETLARLHDHLENRIVSYPFMEEAEIISAITAGDVHNALVSFDKAVASVLESRPSDVVANRILQKLCETINMHLKYGGKINVPTFADEAPSAHVASQLREYLLNLFSEETTDHSGLVVEQIKAFLKTNYDKNITLKTLETEFFLNASYISRIFKQYEGKNYSDYLLDIRVRHACEMLVNTDRPILLISQKSGFGNSKYFSKIFKEVTGMSPMEYRNANRK